MTFAFASATDDKFKILVLIALGMTQLPEQQHLPEESILERLDEIQTEINKILRTLKHNTMNIARECEVQNTDNKQYYGLGNERIVLRQRPEFVDFWRHVEEFIN